jgi:hypothetical protein
MIHSRKTILIVTLLALVVLTTASNVINGSEFKNLKVLPKDISGRQLDSIMDSYNRALKVSCDFCHIAPKKDMFSLDKTPPQIDFALDNPMKEEARRMMRLTIEINKNHFYFDSTKRPEFLNVISCNTCHRGNPYPVYE